MPKNNQEFWINKLLGNKDRDKFVTRELRKMGWGVIRVWEHELKSPLRVAGKIKKALNRMQR
jgi:DNA mismatch endonuclease (patch repair protein)